MCTTYWSKGIIYVISVTWWALDCVDFGVDLRVQKQDISMVFAFAM
jgi:hypothetical protein